MGARGPGAKPVKKRRFLNSVERAKKPGPTAFRPWEVPGLSRADRVVAFLETLPITSGNLSGQNFKVRDWQRRDIIDPIYATDEAGVRFVREAIISMPRKNGKTGLIAGLCLCHLCGPEALTRGQVASGAADRDQAALIFSEMSAIIERVPWMDERISVKSFNKQLEDADTGTTYKALSSESKTKHGLSLSFWIYDELAQAPDRKLYDVLSTASAAWLEPLGIVISTQADNSQHIMSELYDDGEQILSGVVTDRSRHACIYSAPKDADPWSEDVWFKCNPALGDFRSIEEMRAYALKAKRMPAVEQTFRLLYLNQRISGDVRWIPKPLWDACGMNPESFDVDSLKGRRCFGALDLSGSGKNDLTALVLLFDVDDKVKALPFFWAAETGLEEAEARDRVTYRAWAKQGFLRTTPGRVLDYSFIAQSFCELEAMYQIECIAADPNGLEKMMDALDKAGSNLVMKKHLQGIVAMDQPIKDAEKYVLAERLRHPNNPVLTWCVDNVKMVFDSTGNKKFDKRKATGRIDGAQALAMACGLMASQPETPSYEVTWF